MITREELVESGYVVKQRGRAHDRDPHHVTNRRTPSPETRAVAEDPSPTSEVDADEVTLGAYGDRPLEARPGVVAPSPYYVIIGGGDRHCQPSYDRYEAGEAFQEWYGAYGAEHHMRAGSIARCFPQIPGAAHPADRARRMVEDLRRQGAQLKPQTCEEMQESPRRETTRGETEMRRRCSKR